jgi:hypothetical protein
MTPHTDDLWNPISIDDAAIRFAAFDVDWWVAGGQAIDLFLGWETRKHNDLDLEMFRSDRDVLFDVFAGWDFYTVSEGAFSKWERGAQIAPPVFGIWGRPTPNDPWAVEIMLADGDMTDGAATTWRFRRDNEISLPRSLLTATSQTGIRYCTPEVQLLYKSKQSRPKDDVDMVRCLHRMTSSQRTWLADAIRRGDPVHSWIRLLESANSMQTNDL